MLGDGSSESTHCLGGPGGGLTPLFFILIFPSGSIQDLVSMAVRLDSIPGDLHSEGSVLELSSCLLSPQKST